MSAFIIIFIIALVLTLWVAQLAFQLWGASGRARRAQAEQEKAYWAAVISGYAEAIQTAEQMQEQKTDEFRATMRARGCTGADDCCCHGCCPGAANVRSCGCAGATCICDVNAILTPTRGR